MKTKQLSVITGILYLSLIFIGPISIMIIPEMFNGASDLASYVNNNQSLLRIWLIADLSLITIEIILTTTLYLLLAKLDKTKALIAFITRLMMIVVMIVNSFMILLMLNETTPDVMLSTYLYLHGAGAYIWGVFFFIHVLVLGLILLKVTHIKNWIAYSLVIGSFGYLLDSTLFITNISSQLASIILAATLVIVVIGEVTFGVMLVRNKVIVE